MLDNTVGLHWNQMTNAQRQASAINTGNVVWDGQATTIKAPQLLDKAARLSVTSPALGDFPAGRASFGAALTQAGYGRVDVRVGDGSLGVPERGPFDGIAVAAAAPRVPAALYGQLALGGRPWPDQPLLASALRSLRVTLTALAVSLPLLALLALITFVFPPASVVTIPLKFIVTGLAVAYDFLDYPLGLRGAGVRSRVDLP